MDKRLAEWFASRDTGLSSECIALYLSAGVSNGTTPLDLSDWGRCMRLLEKIPEWPARMGEMAKASKGWAVFAEHWQALTDTFKAETGKAAPPKYDWPKCPRTAKQFQAIRAEVDEAEGVIRFGAKGFGVSMRM